MTRRQKMERLFDVLKSDMEETVLDREVRAVENYMTGLRQSVFPLGWRRYFINKESHSGILADQGYAWVYCGHATIYYSPHSKRLEQMVSIGHELSHICAEHGKIPVDFSQPVNTDDIENPVLETEATFLSGKFVKLRSEQYCDEDGYVKDRQHNDEEIDVAIKFIQPDYDESLLDD